MAEAPGAEAPVAAAVDTVTGTSEGAIAVSAAKLVDAVDAMNTAQVAGGGIPFEWDSAKSSASLVYTDGKVVQTVKVAISAIDADNSNLSVSVTVAGPGLYADAAKQLSDTYDEATLQASGGTAAELAPRLIEETLQASAYELGHFIASVAVNGPGILQPDAGGVGVA